MCQTIGLPDQRNHSTLRAVRVLATLSLSALIAFCPLLTAVSAAQPKPLLVPIVITHATIINPGTSSVQTNRTVVISDDHIKAVSDSAKFQPPNNTRVIDATGQYLIPGLWDMHVHSAFGDWFPGGRDIILPLFVANGVTAVRDMGGDAPVLLQWRKEIADGQIIGPHMIISGPMLDGYLPNGKLRFPSSIAITTPASAIAAVDSLKAQGVDFEYKPSNICGNEISSQESLGSQPKTLRESSVSCSLLIRRD
jgi:hypothetical protein